MKLTPAFLSLLITGVSSFAFAGPIFYGKVQNATGYLARAGYTNCEITVESESDDGLVVDFSLLNANTGNILTLPNLNLTKEGRIGVLEKMMYDLGVRTAPQPINDPSITPQATLVYNNLVKVKNGGSRIEYHLQELRSNGEFYGATSGLVCNAQTNN
jgi:hypothetical protein